MRYLNALYTVFVIRQAESILLYPIYRSGRSLADSSPPYRGQGLLGGYDKDDSGTGKAFAAATDKAGADFKRQFTVDSYRQFFQDAGYSDVKITMADGRIPCAVAVMKKVNYT